VQADADVNIGQVPRLNLQVASVVCSWATVQCCQLLCVIAGRRDGIKSWLVNRCRTDRPWITINANADFSSACGS
jgi:hypothetical protein